MTKTADAIIIAREYRGMTQLELAEGVKLSQGAMSKIENGILAPSPEVLQRIARTLEFPERFFREEIDPEKLPYRFYRKRKSVRQQALRSIEARVRILRTHIRKLLYATELDPPLYKELQPRGIDSAHPETTARQCRLAMRLPRGPVANVTEAVEKAGVIVVPCKFGFEGVDGFSMYDGVMPAMIFMSIDVPGDRWRFTLAHELGHIVLHSHVGAVKSDEELDDQADRFASEFLMPSHDIKPHFIPRLTFKRLLSLKAHWGVSMAALVMRAEQVGKLSKHQKRRIFTNMSRAGYRKSEPNPIPREIPCVLSNLFTYYLDHMAYTNDELLDALAVTEQESAKLYPGVFKPRRQLRLLPDPGRHLLEEEPSS